MHNRDAESIQHVPVSHFQSCQSAFTPEEIERIIAIGEALPKENAEVRAAGNAKDLYLHKKRRTEIAWIAHNDHTHWLFEKLFGIAAQVNRDHYRYDFVAFENHALQYTVYHGSNTEPGHFDWHMDMIKRDPARKLTVVASLSDPRAYEGGELQYNDGAVKKANQNRGAVNAFPSWMLHRVTPVTKGVRRTLVGWLEGPRFR